MPADDHAQLPVSALVELMYRADWTSLSVALDVREFNDWAASSRMHAVRPPWLRESGPAATAWASRRSRPERNWEPDPDDDPGDDAPDEDDGPDEDGGDAGQRPAQTEHSYRLTIAPGGRFRTDDANGQLAGSDGHDAVLPPCLDLLLPGWLPAWFELELAGPALVAGRRTHRLIGRPRPAGNRLRSRPGRSRSGQYRLVPPHRQLTDSVLTRIDRVDVAVDAELGILLRCELLHRGQVVSRKEITGVNAGPPGAEAAPSFAPPPAGGAEDGGSLFAGPGWDRAKSAANAGATALNFVLKHAPHRQQPAGARAGAPPEYAATAPDDAPAAPVSGQIVRLLYEAGLRSTAFSAELRTWADTTMSAEALKAAASKTSLAGVTRLAETMTERATTWQERDLVSVGLPHRYRIDYIDGGYKPRKIRSEVCDGARRWRLFPGHVSVGAARPLPEDIGRLADPAWLLEWELTGSTEITVDGRRAYLIRVRPAGPAPRGRFARGFAMIVDTPVEVVLDAESGVVLRLLTEQDGRPSSQHVLAGLTARPQSTAAEFQPEIPAHMRVVQDSGTMLDEAELPAPAQTAVRLTVSTLKTAARVGGFLESMREQRKRPGPR
jgi:hypothetical protein